MMRLRFELWRAQWLERASVWVAWHLPRRVAYWATIRLAVEDNEDYPGDRTVIEVLDGWWHTLVDDGTIELDESANVTYKNSRRRGGT